MAGGAQLECAWPAGFRTRATRSPRAPWDGKGEGNDDTKSIISCDSMLPWTVLMHGVSQMWLVCPVVASQVSLLLPVCSSRVT